MTKWLVALACLWPCAAMGQQPLVCFPAQDWLTGLERDYGEHLRWQGELDQGGGYMLLMTNEDTHTWTLGRARTDGTVCPLLSGTAAELIERTKPIRWTR